MEGPTYNKKILSPIISTNKILDFMEKNFASLRLILKSRGLLRAEWSDNNSSDVAITLVELLVYVGDHLSYYQDAVATEAYLGTSRNRISVKRYNIMLDSLIHKNCNPRDWLSFEVDKNCDSEVSADANEGSDFEAPFLVKSDFKSPLYAWLLSIHSFEFR